MKAKPSCTLTMFEENMGRKRGQRRGHLLEKSGNWLLRYYVDSTEIDEKTNRPKRDRITVTLCRSKGPGAKGKRDAARIAWEEYLSVLDSAHTRPSSAKTFLEFVNQKFRPDVIENLKPTGKAFYECLLRRHVIPAIGSVSLRALSLAHIQSLCNVSRNRGLSPKTVREIRKCVSAVLNHAKAHKWFFGELPTEGVRLPELIQEKRRAMTWDQVCKLVAALPDPCATLVLLMVVTGLRIGEAMGLRWYRVNLTAESKPMDSETLPPYSIAVRESYVMGRYQTLKPSPAGPRIIPIPEWFAPRVAALGTADQTNTSLPVFVNNSGLAPIDQHNLAARTLKPVATALGMPWVSWHVCRHTWATLSDKLGLTQSERMKVLGHTTTAVTMGYTHPELEAVREKLKGLPKLN